jgi:hypothetical protein
MNWDTAIYEAWRFSKKCRYFEGDQEIKDQAYYALPEIVKKALTYLCENGELN